MAVTSNTFLRPCPNCRGTFKKQLHLVDDLWDISRCIVCRFVFSSRTRENTASEIDLPGDYEPVFRARHRQVNRLLEGLLPEGELVADVGCGFGVLGSIVNARRRYRYVGFEPSSTVAAASGRRGVSVRNEIFTAKSLGEPAGAVVLDNVIEHVGDPLHLLQECAAALKPGGLLVVIVPNRWDIRQLVPSWRRNNHWIPPEHINYFTSRTLSIAFERLGMQARPFAFRALGLKDWRYFPRAALEMLGIYPFGLNFYGVKQ